MEMFVVTILPLSDIMNTDFPSDATKGTVFMTENRRDWVGRRFGRIEETILGRMEDVKEIVWPDMVEHYEVDGNILTYRLMSDIEASAERIAEIYRRGAYEMIHNSEIEWHHDPEQIVMKVDTGDWNFYGCYLGGTLIAIESMYIARGDRTMEWVWGCVDPAYRGLGVWRNIGVYSDRIVEKSGAQAGSAWVVTTHKYSQMTLEQAGYTPMGCFIGKRFYGGSDNRYYRHTLIHYAKLYGEGRKHLQQWDSMQLTEKAARVVNAVRGLWEDTEK